MNSEFRKKLILLCPNSKRKAAEAQLHQHKESQYYSGYIGNQMPKNYPKRELPWPPPPSEGESAYAEENEYSYIAEIPPAPASAGIAIGAAHYPEPPKYFEFDPNGEQVRVSANGERYVISGVMDGRAVIANRASSRKELDRRLKQPRNYNGTNSAVGHGTYSPQGTTAERYISDGQNHISV